MGFIHKSNPELVGVRLSADTEYKNISQRIQKLVAKKYIKPEKIFCEANIHSRTIKENFDGALSMLSHYAFSREVTRNCPLCDHSGYIAGICKNPNCSGEKNKQKYKEDKKNKKEEHRAKSLPTHC